MELVIGADGTAVTTVSVRSSLGDAAPYWDELVLRSRLPSPFLLSWWLEATALGKPRYILVYQGYQLLGGLALQETTRFGLRQLQVLGDGPLCLDHLDVVCAAEHVTIVLRHLVRWFTDVGSALIKLDGLVPDSYLTGILPKPVRSVVCGTAPWAPLGSSFEAFLASRPSRTRRSVRYRQRRLAAVGVQYRRAPFSDIERSLRNLRGLHAKQRGANSSFLQGWAEFSRAAVEGARRGHVKFHELVRGDHVVASVVLFEFGGRASAVQSGRVIDDPSLSGAGTVLFAEAIKHAIDSGCHEIDFLRGDEAYKKGWTTGSRQLLRLRSATGYAARTALLGYDALALTRQVKRRLTKSAI